MSQKIEFFSITAQAILSRFSFFDYHKNIYFLNEHNAKIVGILEFMEEPDIKLYYLLVILVNY